MNPDGCPAADSSDFALAMFIARWATVWFVDGKTGANGLSLPMAALPLNSACTMAGRSSVSAIACRTRGSVNGAWSQRIDSCRCALDLRLMMLYGAPGASNCGNVHVVLVGSGEFTRGSLRTWFLVHTVAIPVTLVALGLGAVRLTRGGRVTEPPPD